MTTSDLSQPIARYVMPKAIWVLGFVSLFMDVSSEIVHGLLPLAMITVLSTHYFLIFHFCLQVLPSKLEGFVSNGE